MSKKDLSLTRREIDEELGREMEKSLDTFGILDNDIKPEAVKMLAHSPAFRSFLSFVEDRNGPSKHVTKVIDAGESFQRHFREEHADTKEISWTDALHRFNPGILEDSLGQDIRLSDDRVIGGWHSVWTPKPDSENGYMMIGAKRKEYESLDDGRQRKVLDRTFPGSKDGYDNIRHRSAKTEAISGLRSGRIHIFLADDALAKFDGIALDDSYLKADPDQLVVFTMHARFFFVCSAQDLTDWLKTSDAREAFDNKLRLMGHMYPVADRDMQDIQAESVLPLKSWLDGLGDRVEKIGADNLPGAYLGALDKATKATHPHLTWKPTQEQLRIRERISDLMS